MATVAALWKNHPPCGPIVLAAPVVVVCQHRYSRHYSAPSYLAQRDLKLSVFIMSFVPDDNTFHSSVLIAVRPCLLRPARLLPTASHCFIYFSNLFVDAVVQ